MLIAQISDLHICPKGDLAYGVSETNLFAERAIHALMRLDPMPDCVILTGDLAENGYEEEYAIASELLGRLSCPVYVIPGNHDRREPMRHAFESRGYLPRTGPLNYSISCGELQLIALDSLEEGSGIGVLTEETLDFLSSALSDAKDRPTLVMLHHPPFMTGIGHMDVVRLVDGAQRLESIISAHPQVQRVLCGHVHRSIQQVFAGTLCQIAPSVAHQVMLDLRPEAPSCFVLEPPGYLLHMWRGGKIVTHTAQVDRAAGPFSFNLPETYTSRAVVHGKSVR
jgi:3',5'-cyclic-AMP phosphodiesterase